MDEDKCVLVLNNESAGKSESPYMENLSFKVESKTNKQSIS